jgi:hypothetical protein
VTDATQWTPREALEAMIRDIDAGHVNPDALVICFRHGVNPGFMAAGADVVTMIGIVESAKLLIHEAAK